MVYSPMARGILSGKYKSLDDVPAGSRAARGERLIKGYFTERNFQLVNHYRKLAEENELSLSQFSLAWVLNQSAVTCAIVGASKVHHITDAAAVSEFNMTDELLREIDEVTF